MSLMNYQPRIRQFSYQNVLHARAVVDHLDTMAQFAKELGYRYFLWNDHLFELTESGCVDTGFTDANVL